MHAWNVFADDDRSIKGPANFLPLGDPLIFILLIRTEDSVFDN